MYKTYIGVGAIAVYDKFGQLFYSYFPINNKPFLFNLNLEKFTFTGEIYTSKKKMIYKVNLPNNNVKMPQNINVIFTNNGEKASINLTKGLLTIDDKYRSQPFFILAFLYGHEFAHLLYPSPNGIRSTQNEFNCDKFAANLMLKRGYNPSQILAAMKFSLDDGPEQNDRFSLMVNYLNSIKTKLINY